MKIGDRVRIRPGGASIFVIVDLDDEVRAVIETVDDAPGKYPFPMRLDSLVVA